jgi:hypothetical protein
LHILLEHIYDSRRKEHARLFQTLTPGTSK